jgi:hypothetical protein
MPQTPSVHAVSVAICWSIIVGSIPWARACTEASSAADINFALDSSGGSGNFEFCLPTNGCARCSSHNLVVLLRTGDNLSSQQPVDDCEMLPYDVCVCLRLVWGRTCIQQAWMSAHLLSSLRSSTQDALKLSATTLKMHNGIIYTPLQGVSRVLLARGPNVR